MTQNEIDLDWSTWIASNIISELCQAMIITSEETAKRAKEIVAQGIHVHLVSDDRPEAAGWRYRDGKIPPNPK